MASVIKLSRIFSKSAVHRGFFPVVSNRKGYAVFEHLKDWKPGPCPTTPAERAAAAEKYGLRPEDYKVFQNDGREWGDYPDLPHRPITDRDAFHAWDFPRMRRDYMDPVNVDLDGLYGHVYQKPSEHDESPRSWLWRGTVWLVMLGMMWFVAVGFDRIVSSRQLFPTVCKKQYPYMGETHYSFNKPGEEPPSHH